MYTHLLTNMIVVAVAAIDNPAAAISTCVLHKITNIHGETHRTSGVSSDRVDEREGRQSCLQSGVHSTRDRYHTRGKCKCCHARERWDYWHPSHLLVVQQRDDIKHALYVLDCCVAHRVRWYPWYIVE